MERTALGLMSGTSLDGIDAALLRTDATRVTAFGPALTVPYDPAFRDRLRAVVGRPPDSACEAVARELTERHAAAVAELLARPDAAGWRPDVIGFHGHTVFHAPENRCTYQIGDGALLAVRTGIAVVADFRSADVAAGGQGAPLAPLYHAALAEDLEKPVAVLNLGGVGNVTHIGTEAVIAFDTGPGNALIDDWMVRHTGRPMDRDGRLAASGRVDAAALDALAADPWFDLRPPKSLDRDAFDAAPVAGLSPADGAATLAAFTAAAVARARDHLPAAPRRWLVCGGGRHNPVLMAMLRDRLGVPVEPVEAVGWDGDALEAQAFAFLAVRVRAGLPTSLPSTTGTPVPTCGGAVYLPGASASAAASAVSR